jgi:Tol biopolymer transport system component
VEDFFRPPACIGAELSPDGTKVAYEAGDGWDTKLAVQDLKTGKVVRMGFDRALQLARFDWKGNDQLIVRLKRDGYGTGEIFIAAADR